MTSRRLLPAVLSVVLVTVALGSTLAVAAEPATAPPHVQTTLVWIFGDDDFLHAPSETSPPSPGASIGDRAGYDSLFEGAASRYTGRENRSELRLAGVAPGLFPGVATRAEIALGVDLSSLGGRPAPLLVEDLGSFAELEISLGRGRPARKDALSIRLFPVNGDRERVGALETLAWGGAVGPEAESPYASSHGPVRAGRVELGLGFVGAHAGLKTAPFLESQPAGPAVEETSYGVFGGVESRFSVPVGVALGFGHFEHGRLPGPAGSPRATTTGGSLRLSFGTGLRVAAPPLGFTHDGSPFDPTARTSKTHGFAISVEGAHLVQRLWDFDHPGAAVLAPARGAALLSELVAGAFDLRVLVSVRDPAFVMRNGPGIFSHQTAPRSAAERLELGALASVGVTFGALEASVLPSLTFGVLSPAAVMTRAVDRSGQPMGATLVVRGPSEGELLPPGEVPVPVLELRPACELRLSRSFTALAWLEYERDFNRTRLVATPEGALGRGFHDPNRLGYGVAGRAVW